MQIRKMVGLALAVYRGAAPFTSLELALDQQRIVDVRVAVVVDW
jgi:tRNA U38,U39,U40 pseudouridine synthase TruA